MKVLVKTRLVLWFFFNMSSCLVVTLLQLARPGSSHPLLNVFPAVFTCRSLKRKGWGECLLQYKTSDICQGIIHVPI